MWSQRQLKERARQRLFGQKGHYGRCVLACLLPSILGSFLLYMLPSWSGFAQTSYQMFNQWLLKTWIRPGGPWVSVVLVLGASLAAGLLTSAAIYWVAAMCRTPFAVGYQRWLLRDREGDAPLRLLFSGFGRYYWNLVRCVFSVLIRVVLWALLLFVPGAYKYLQYCMVPWLLADAPGLSPRRVREMSAAMTEGEKWNILALLLSLLVWYLPALLVSCLFFRTGWLPISVAVWSVAVFLIAPYCNAVFAELYVVLRDKAAKQGRINRKELGLPVRHKSGR